ERCSSSLITGASLIASGRVPKTVRTLIMCRGSGGFRGRIRQDERPATPILTRLLGSPGNHGLVDLRQPPGQLGPAVAFERPFPCTLAEPLSARLVRQQLDQRLPEPV